MQSKWYQKLSVELILKTLVLIWSCWHHAPNSRNTINLSRIKIFSSTFKENPKFLFFHSSNLFVYKLTSSSTASSTIFKYFKSWWWCLLKHSSSSVLFYLDNLIPRAYAFKAGTCEKILIICKNRFYYMTKKRKKKNAG